MTKIKTSLSTDIFVFSKQSACLKKKRFLYKSINDRVICCEFSFVHFQPNKEKSNKTTLHYFKNMSKGISKCLCQTTQRYAVQKHWFNAAHMQDLIYYSTKLKEKAYSDEL